MVEVDLTNNVVWTVANVDKLKDTLGGLHLTYNHLRGTRRTVATDKDGGRVAPRVNALDCCPSARFLCLCCVVPQMYHRPKTRTLCIDTKLANSQPTQH